MTHSHGLITLCPPGAGGCPPAPGPPPAARDDPVTRAATLCAQALTAARSGTAPPAELLWLAEQLCDCNRSLARLARAGAIAAAAYDRGRDDEQAARRWPV